MIKKSIRISETEAGIYQVDVNGFNQAEIIGVLEYVKQHTLEDKKKKHNEILKSTKKKPRTNVKN